MSSHRRGASRRERIEQTRDRMNERIGESGKIERKKVRAFRKSRRKKYSRFARMRAWKKALVWIAAALAVVVGTSATYVTAKWNMLDTEEIPTDELVINEEILTNIDLGDGYTNIAIFGIDSRDGLTDTGTRSDSIIIFSLNNETKEIKMVSVYRDTLLNLSDGTYAKCNAAYSYGGATMAVNMLNMNLDLNIEDYVTVDFSAVAEVIDLLGGVEITIEEEELTAFNKYVTETASVAGTTANYISSAGTYLMDGTQATTYARIRSTAGGDFTRTERQRLVIEKIVEKMQEADLTTLNSIINEIFPNISTSLTLQEIIYYAQAYQDYTLGENAGFPFDKNTDTLSGLGSIVYPVNNLVENVSELHEFLFGTEDYVPSSTVQTISAAITSRLSQYAVSDTDGTADSNDYGNDTSSSDSSSESYSYSYNEGSTSFGTEDDHSASEDTGQSSSSGGTSSDSSGSSSSGSSGDTSSGNSGSSGSTSSGSSGSSGSTSSGSSGSSGSTSSGSSGSSGSTSSGNSGSTDSSGTDSSGEGDAVE